LEAPPDPNDGTILPTMRSKPSKPNPEDQAPEPKRKPRGPSKKRETKKKVVEVEVDAGLNHGKRPSKEQLEAREDQAYRLRLLGKTPEEIGEVFGVTDRQVRTYLERAKERTVEDLRRLEGKAGIVRQFWVLNHVLDESLAAWERSKEVKKIKTAGVETGGIGEVSGVIKRKTGQREEDQIGDPSYLDRALKASAEIRALLGLDAPTVKRILVADDPIMKENEDEDYSSVPTEELLRRYRAAIGLGSELGK